MIINTVSLQRSDRTFLRSDDASHLLEAIRPFFVPLRATLFRLARSQIMEAQSCGIARAVGASGDIDTVANAEPILDGFKSHTGDCEVIRMSEEDSEGASKSCDYVKKWRKRSQLKILQPGLVRAALKRSDKEMGLFHLFANRGFLEGVRKWTCESMIEKHQEPPSSSKFNACIGLEIATSVARCNDIKDYWGQKMFLGCPGFSAVMSRSDFQRIRSGLTLHPKYAHDEAVADPLWRSRHVLNHFVQNSASVAVPLGATSLDETTIRCKARTRARTCMNSKPTKYGIRFYSVVSWKEAYLHTFWDNGSGNETRTNSAESYCALFRGLRGVFHRNFSKRSVVSPKKPSALWIMQLAHQHKSYKDPSGERLVVMDNFHTRHPLARQLANATDGEMKVLGTVRFNNIDKLNRPLVKQAVERLGDKEKGDWFLAHAHHADAKGNVKVSSNAGCIIFKDRAIVVFYSNDLAQTPSAPLVEATDEAIACVHGLASMSRWRGDESFHRSVIKVPSLALACSVFMNGVDRFDQLRSTNAIVRKEKRVSMSLFTFMLDAAVLNAFALSKQESPELTMTARGFKRRIAEALVAPELMKKQGRAKEMPKASAESNFTTTHFLLENKGKKFVNCCLCADVSGNEKRLKTAFSCSQCEKGHHVNCFAFRHFPEVARRKRPAAQNFIEQSEKRKAIKKRRGRKPMSVSSVETCALPFLPWREEHSTHEN